MTITTTSYFGGCPYCGGCDGYYNLEREHWLVCDQCRTAWCYGANIFNSWRQEDEAQWTRNEAALAGYVAVTPIFPEEPLKEPTEVSIPLRQAPLQ
jgi:hypothetical protein